ncbi:type I-E CRISPR-associated protein Cas7/Cse4/CasC [Leucobacter weissii]|uniref:Type I-E CRISPR-associated protein Cas7/Cse4/CasC n=1 Tax=Leucobacter weissii TaxID=1983706 RepID=A0A939SAL7_9MICO|nr:type I-E CRISPR-associated protein Cas7/Cse4/CasC [Leucobacter weissii]MBO1900538.1 type I-E CRISPR-associated protein Cas7/Cse4/CasC [Leucobacter weissii]
MSIFIDLHALHTVPPSNINRDDTGAPKTAFYGGVQRHRVSSQAWKRAIRKVFPDYLDADALGERTRRVGELVLKRAQAIEPNVDIAELEKSLVASFAQFKWKLEAPKTKEETEENAYPYVRSSYLAFFSTRQIEKLARALLALEPGGKIPKKELEAILDTEQSVDIALFGRMIADAPDFNVDAAAQVAHAISVHESTSEHDYYTAVDDVIESSEEETGAGMIGTIEFASSTLYRYATVHLDGLAENLGDATAAKQAAIAFAQAFITSQPTGKQNTFANQTLPELVLISVRTDRPISYVNAFEEPIVSDSGRRKAAAEKLVDEVRAVERGYGLTAKHTFVIGVGETASVAAELGEAVPFTEIADRLGAALTAAGE